MIARLPRIARLNLLRACEPFVLKLSDILSEGGRPIRHVYFPIGGYVSMVTRLDGRPVLEVGMVGHEGVIGAQLVLGVATEPLHAVVQGAGSAWRIGKARFQRELGDSPKLRLALSRYLHVTMTQLASSAACLRFHQIGPRLARWLLMTQDRALSDHFYVTHEFLSFMLGVRRVGITQAAATLQRRGLLEYRRGNITILNRRGLIEAACSCYTGDIETYATLLRQRA